MLVLMYEALCACSARHEGCHRQPPSAERPGRRAREACAADASLCLCCSSAKHLGAAQC